VLRRKPGAGDVNLQFYRHYFSAIRKRLVADLSSGTSKRTISKDALEDYEVETFDRDEQDRFVSSYVTRVDRLQQELEETTAELQAAMKSVRTV
jgi:hypothetical protein